MGSNAVVLKGCKTYDRAAVTEAVAGLFEALGGPGAFASEGQSVFIKVNALLGAAPEKAVTTHPEVVRAVVEQFKSVTDRITIGDSPGGPFTAGYLKRVYEKTGFAEVARETGAELGLDTSTTQVQIPGGKALKTIMICSAMHDADCLVSVAKFKTHMFLNMSGAIKNLFGTVPGVNKFTYHSRFPKDADFSDLIVDVVLASAPDLHVVDGVVGMDGNGPRVGNIIEMEFMAAGTDPFAVDLALMALIGIEPEKNKALAAGIRRGLCSGEMRNLQLLGDDIDSLRYSGFRLPDKKDISERVPDFVMKRFGERMALRPVPIEGKCTVCKKCVEICPAGAIAIEGKVAVVDLKKCQRCYCCHELCEHDAIELERPLLMKLMRVNRDM